MSKISTFNRRHARYPAGIETGGGETGFYPQPQLHDYMVALFGAAGAFKDVLLPKGTILTHSLVMPYNGGSGGAGPDGVPATGGTVAIDTWNITTNASITSLLGSTSAAALSLVPFGAQNLASSGSFTLAAASSTVVNNAAVTANSRIALTPTNAAAATLMAGLTSLFVSARSAGVSFTVATANAAAAAGTETFEYTIINPPLIASLAQQNEVRVRFRVLTTITPFVAGAQGNGAVLVGLRAYMPRTRP